MAHQHYYLDQIQVFFVNGLNAETMAPKFWKCYILIFLFFQVCRDVESGTLGKCCRDRDYQDAWPSANLVNGVDDGKYAEDDSIGQYKGNGK